MKNFIYYDEGLFVKHERDEDPAGVSYTMHTHELFEIYYFLSGNARNVMSITKGIY